MSRGAARDRGRAGRQAVGDDSDCPRAADGNRWRRRGCHLGSHAAPAPARNGPSRGSFVGAGPRTRRCDRSTCPRPCPGPGGAPRSRLQRASHAPDRRRDGPDRPPHSTPRSAVARVRARAIDRPTYLPGRSTSGRDNVPGPSRSTTAGTTSPCTVSPSPSAARTPAPGTSERERRGPRCPAPGRTVSPARPAPTRHLVAGCRGGCTQAPGTPAGPASRDAAQFTEFAVRGWCGADSCVHGQHAGRRPVACSRVTPRAT